MREDLLFKIGAVFIIFGLLLLVISYFWFPFYLILSVITIIIGIITLIAPKFKGYENKERKIEFSGKNIAFGALLLLVFGILLNVISEFFMEEGGLGNPLVFLGFVILVIAIGVDTFQTHWH